MSRLTGAVVFVLLIGGCTPLPEKPDVDSQSLWREHRLLLEGIRSWNIKGRIAIKNDAGSGTLHVYWKQQNAAYELHLIAPLGQGSYLLKGSDTGVVMAGSDGIHLTAATAQELIRRNLGWDIDVDGLQYWVRGVPSPLTDYRRLLLDDKGRLETMEQSGFEIRIARYTEIEGVALPKRLSLRNNDIQLKVVIQSWEIPQQI